MAFEMPSTNIRNFFVANHYVVYKWKNTARISFGKNELCLRPILRGRDIKRYSYQYADLYLISTFPAKGYDIDDYPAVKDYLLKFGIERLEQTGKEHIINGERVKARKKTSNKWYETQDSISYWVVLFPRSSCAHRPNGSCPVFHFSCLLR